MPYGWQGKGNAIKIVPNKEMLIETLWRKIKYEWIKPHDYLNCDTLSKAVTNFVCKFGQEFSIYFD